jgi:ketosteroid isomerase-like protein
MMLKTFLSVSTIILLLTCQPVVDVQVEQEKLLQTDRAFAAYSVENGAAEAFNKYLTEDAMQLPAGRNPVFGREIIYQGMMKNQGKYVLDWKPQQAEVSLSGDLGYSWGTYTFSYTSTDGDTTEYGKYVNIWKKQEDGNWRVFLDTGNDNPKPE